MSDDKTLIQVTRKTAKKLKDFKITDNESYECIIKRKILEELTPVKNQGEVSDEAGE